MQRKSCARKLSKPVLGRTSVPQFFWYTIRVNQNHARATQVSATVEESIQESTSGAQTPVVGKGAHESTCDATALSQTHLQGNRYTPVRDAGTNAN